VSNVEGMYSVYFTKRMSEAKPLFEILRFLVLRFCGSLFIHAESHTRRERRQGTSFSFLNARMKLYEIRCHFREVSS